MKSMTHPPRRRTRLGIAISQRLAVSSFALFAALSNGVAAPADAVNGERLAKQWCASCHIVSSDQTRGADFAPPFASIARHPGFTAHRTAQFLMRSHPRMPDVHLTRDEARDLGAYIATLAH
jgi:mono/diheme cytochrome c family protein